MFQGEGIRQFDVYRIIESICPIKLFGSFNSRNLTMKSPSIIYRNLAPSFLSLDAIFISIQTVAVGAAIGQACLLLAAGKKGRRFMMPHAKAMIQQPRAPSSGQMPASDVIIRAKEVLTNRDTLVELLSKHTGNSFEKVSKAMQRPFYMDAVKAQEFGVIDKILWRGQEKVMDDAASPEDWDRRAGIKVVDGM